MDATLARNLYVSHALCVFGDRLWQFAVPVLLIYIFPTTLFPTAVFNLVLYLGRVACLPAIGRWLDRAPRIQALQATCFVQCPLVALSALFLFLAHGALPPLPDEEADSLAQWWGSIGGAAQACFVLAQLVGCIGDLAGQAGTIGVEKDWLTVIEPDEQARMGLTATMRRIDLSCKLLAPLVCGLVIQLADDHVRAGVLLVAGWNLLTAVPVYFCWKAVFDAVPDLANKPELTGRKEKTPWAVATYVKHATFVPCVSYACLYFTVLSDHHPVATAYFIERGCPAVALALARGGGALTGILGTYWQPQMAEAHGPVQAGLRSVWAFLGTVAVIGASFGLDANGVQIGTFDYTPYIALLMIVLSRCALWAFDLTNANLIQTHVASYERGVIASTQTANCQLFELFMCLLCVYYSRLSDFYHLAYFSIAGVGMAAVLYTLSLGALNRLEAQDASAPLK